MITKQQKPLLGRTRLDNKKLNLINFLVSIIVLGTGLLLFLEFHIGDGAFRKEYLGVGKYFWLFIHQTAAIVFTLGFVLHILAHRGRLAEIVRRWRKDLPAAIKIRTLEQIVLSGVLLIVTWAGFYPWITMPGATLEVGTYHGWIDIHTRIGLFLLIGISIHMVRRLPRLFTTGHGGPMPGSKEMETLGIQMNYQDKKKAAKRSRNKSTRFIIADTTRCEACWVCLDECDFNVLGKLNIWIHKHVIIKNADACRGCKKCVAVCPNGVFLPL